MSDDNTSPQFTQNPNWFKDAAPDSGQYINQLNSGADAFRQKGIGYAARYAGNDWTDSSGNTAMASQRLGSLRQFDPNASVSAEWIPEEAGRNLANSETGTQMSASTPGYWKHNFTYNQSKVPTIGAGLNNLSPAQKQNLQYVGNLDESKENVLKKFKYIHDPNAVWKDPNYGWVMDKNNSFEKEGFDWLGTLGPMMVGGFAGALGAGGSLMSMAQGGLGIAKSVSGGGNFGQALLGAGLGAAGGYIGGMTGIPYGSAIGSMAGKTLASNIGPNKVQRSTQTPQPRQQAQIANSPGNVRMNMGYRPPQNYNYIQQQSQNGMQATQGLDATNRAKKQQMQQIRPPAPALRTIYQR